MNTSSKCSNAQHLVEYSKQFLQEENQKSGCHATDYAFLRLGYKFEVSCQIYISRKIGVPEIDRNVFIARKVNMT